MSLISMVEFLFNYHNQNYLYPKGGIRSLIAYLEQELISNGCRINLGKEVKELICQGKRINRIRFTDGSEFFHDFIISNMSLHRLAKTMKGVESLGSKHERGFRYKPTASFFTLVLQGNFTEWEKRGNSGSFLYRYLPDTEPEYWQEVNGQGMFYAHFLNENPRLLRIFYPIAYDDYLEKSHGCETAFQQRLITQLKKACEKWEPKLESKINRQTFLTPLDYEKLTGNFKGAAFGWKMNPEQFGINAVPQTTAYSNLILSGHWTFPGGGIGSVFHSGLGAAKRIKALINA